MNPDPKHPDYQRMSEIAMRLDAHGHNPRLRAARVTAAVQAHDVVDQFFAHDVDPESFLVMCTRRVEMAFNRYQQGNLGTPGEPEALITLVRGMWIEGFMHGQQFEREGGHLA